ncbi:UvrB/UvrC motif-containing protein [Sphingomonas sp. RHCKR47]|uniref:UvrB/UvrC motif-containing protein n=1 Tax=Sphingomonas citricola TaxID=2862498 RepID=UPI001CA5669A|nr:UvrB/UvrC motif-containing protein [Sphingomonas citricola]MBW6524463.1 UvrB/UvrC motif-containing protein [Sphingomonas citricola]
MTNRSFRLYDTMLIVSAPGSERERHGRHVMSWNAPDYETFYRLLDALQGHGFTVERDVGIEERHPSQGKYHRVGSHPTPHGVLSFHAEASPIGCKVEFYQDVVTVNCNGGRYDFDKRQKMPYLIGKAFEAAVRAARAHLVGRGFSERRKLTSPIADPLAYFNQMWDGDFEQRSGIHRFKRGDDGWPTEKELASWRGASDEPRIEQGSVWYFRDRGGRLARGRCYGGINGMWTVIYGPGSRDFTSKARFELFQCSPAAARRREVPAKRGIDRLQHELRSAVSAENFERAIVLRDNLRKAA